MPESRFLQTVRDILQSLGQDVLEERVLNYIVREIQLGRQLSQIIQDPYVRNRISEERLNEILEHKEVIEAVDKQIGQAFENHDFKFKG